MEIFKELMDGSPELALYCSDRLLRWEGGHRIAQLLKLVDEGRGHDVRPYAEHLPKLPQHTKVPKPEIPCQTVQLALGRYPVASRLRMSVAKWYQINKSNTQWKSTKTLSGINKSNPKW
eukprot:1194766-Prorocentrum_minimum.AAC.2